MTTRTSAFRRIPFPLHDPDLRVSDAERTEVADRLPTLDDPPGAPARRESRRTNHTAVILGLVVVLAVTVGHAFWWFFMPPWLAVVLIACVGIYVVKSRERHH